MVTGADFQESLEGAETGEEAVPHSQGDVNYEFCAVLLRGRVIEPELPADQLC